MSVEECSKLIGQYEATDQGKVEGLMSIDGEDLEELEKTKIRIFAGGQSLDGPNNSMPTIGGQSVPWEAYSGGQMRDYVPLVHSGAILKVKRVSLRWSQFYSTKR